MGAISLETAIVLGAEGLPAVADGSAAYSTAPGALVSSSKTRPSKRRSGKSGACGKTVPIARDRRHDADARISLSPETVRQVLERSKTILVERRGRDQGAVA